MDAHGINRAPYDLSAQSHLSTLEWNGSGSSTRSLETLR
jgi:hypothetical protein